jgi:uncharacterized membrane protein YbhN (UPF0104 family)
LKFGDIKFQQTYLILSTLLLWVGFLISTLSWHNVLIKHKIVISKKTAIVSHGLSVFAKYIPGKIWVILGRAAKASGEKYSVKTASYASLKEQILYVWAGLLISSVPLFIYRGFDKFSLAVFLLFAALSVFNFSDKARLIIIWFVKKVFKKELDVPKMNFKESLPVIGYIFLLWFTWIAAFYFLSLSVYPETDFSVGFIFPLSVTIGLLAILFPGGIGVREGIMTGFMVLSGIPIEIATTISVISRLWFVTGEVFIFLMGVILNRKST